VNERQPGVIDAHSALKEQAALEQTAKSLRQLTVIEGFSG